MEYLAAYWKSIPRPEKIRRLQSLIDSGWTIRGLARALKVVGESRIRELLKSGKRTEAAKGRSASPVTAPPAQRAGEGNLPAKHPTTTISVKPESGAEGPHALPQPQDHGVAEPPYRAHQLPSPPVTSLNSRKQPAAAGKEQDRGAIVQPPAMARKGLGEPETGETKPSNAEAATREEPGAGGHAAKPAAPDYAIQDPEAGGQVVAAWIRFTFKHPDWPGVIADYTTAYWFNQLSVHKEVELVKNNIPAGLTPSEVIRHCLSDTIKAGLEGGLFQEARKKWFVCWASLLLPDHAIRRKAVEIAGKILNKPAARWSYIAYDPQLNQPTPCLRSQGTPLADFLEGLAKYVDFRSLLVNGGPQKAEVEEALRYAAATLREGIRPPLD